MILLLQNGGQFVRGIECRFMWVSSIAKLKSVNNDRSTSQNKCAFWGLARNNQNSYILIQENAFEIVFWKMVPFSRPQCVKDVTACVWSFALDLTRTKRINVLRPAQIVHNFAVGIFKCIFYHWFSKQNPYFSVIAIISMRCAHANAVSGIYYTKCAKEWHQYTFNIRTILQEGA